MKNISARYLVWILTAWIGSLGVALPAAATVGERAAACAPNPGVFIVEFATDTSASDRRGDRDDEVILDDQDAIDPDAAPLTGLEDVSFAVAVGESKYQRFAANINLCASRSRAIVEPRFLRYGRLLN